MPRYVYACPRGHEEDVGRPVDDRDRPIACSVCREAMKRRFVAPLVTQWAGKFGNRWAKQRDGEW